MVIKNVGPCLLFWVHNFNDICLFHTLWLNVFGSTGSIGECKVIFANTYTYNIKISLKNKYENHWGVEIPRPNVNNWWNQTDQIRLGLIKPSPVSVWIHTPSLLNSYGFKKWGPIHCEGCSTRGKLNVRCRSKTLLVIDYQYFLQFNIKLLQSRTWLQKTCNWSFLSNLAEWAQEFKFDLILNTWNWPSWIYILLQPFCIWPFKWL